MGKYGNYPEVEIRCSLCDQQFPESQTVRDNKENVYCYPCGNGYWETKLKDTSDPLCDGERELLD